MSICLFVCFTGSFTHASSMTDPMDQSMGDFVREGGGGGGVVGPYMCCYKTLKIESV